MSKDLIWPAEARCIRVFFRLVGSGYIILAIKARIFLFCGGKMKKEDKVKVIEKLQEELSKSKLMVATEYRGLTAAEMTNLRRQLREAGVGFHVVKNTLTRLAASKEGKAGLEKLLTGPTAIAFGYKDEVAAAKTLINYIRTTRSALQIKGGYLGQKALTVAEIQSLALLPAKEVLVSRIVGQLKAPLYGVVGVLSAPLRGLVGVLQARARQLETAPKPEQTAG